MVNICGFMVVRKPEENFDKISLAPYYLPNLSPCINGVCYSGVSRAPWYELEENYYTGDLSNELIELRSELDEINSPNAEPKLMKDFDKAIKILEYSNTIQNRYELIVLFSDKLSKINGSIEIELHVNWLGFDIYYSGYGSQIVEGIYKKPILFNEFIKRLNINGLFNNDEGCIKDYIDKYNKVFLENDLEPMNDLDIELKDVIRIGRIVGYPV